MGYPMTRPHRRVCRDTLCIKIYGTFRVHDSPVRLAKCNDSSLGERIKDVVMSLPHSCIIELNSMFEQSEFERLAWRFMDLMSSMHCSDGE
ncbi:hypothetical protein [Streptomyces phaeochromogenes]